MKKILFFAAILFAALQLSAAPVGLQEAKAAAERFVMQQSVKGKFSALPPGS